MARPLRIEYQDAFCHVMNRGRARQWVFPNPDYYPDYLKGLQEAHAHFGMEIHAYCLTGNHYHPLIKTPRGNLSHASRHIDGLYTPAQRTTAAKTSLARCFAVATRPFLLMPADTAAGQPLYSPQPCGK